MHMFAATGEVPTDLDAGPCWQIAEPTPFKPRRQHDRGTAHQLRTEGSSVAPFRCLDAAGTSAPLGLLAAGSSVLSPEHAAQYALSIPSLLSPGWWTCGAF